jgi:hypothetical protein
MRRNASPSLSPLFRAKLEHRRKARLEVKAPLFDFREVCDEHRSDLALRAHQPPDLRKQLVIGALREIHGFA